MTTVHQILTILKQIHSANSSLAFNRLDTLLTIHNGKPVNGSLPEILKEMKSDGLVELSASNRYTISSKGMDYLARNQKG